jgi:hypothetical protein
MWSGGNSTTSQSPTTMRGPCRAQISQLDKPAESGNLRRNGPSGIATVGQAVHGSTEMGRPQIPARHLMAEKHGIGGEHVGQAATGKLSSQL